MLKSRYTAGPDALERVVSYIEDDEVQARVRMGDPDLKIRIERRKGTRKRRSHEGPFPDVFQIFQGRKPVGSFSGMHWTNVQLFCEALGWSYHGFGRQKR